MLSNADILYSRMAGNIVNLDVSDMSRDERLQLANHCEETRAGLSHCLNFIGDSLVKLASHDVLEFTPTSLYQLGHSLTAISSLQPMLTDLEQFIRADLRKMET